MKVHTDVLVVGSGSSGLITAILLAKAGYKVLVSSKEAVTESSSSYAQGGIAVPIAPEDSFEKHVDDTLSVGNGLADPAVVKHFIHSIVPCIQELSEWGIDFDGWPSSHNMGHEGAHSIKRVLRVGTGGMSGRVLMKGLWEIASRHPNISIAQGGILVELLQNSAKDCIGGVFLDLNSNMYSVLAKYTVLASGGYAHIYSRSTTPEVITGDGVSLASNIGAELRDLDLVQFHPTAIKAGSKYFLLSEALRGEGAQLINAKGERFMNKYAPDQLELASRGVVSKAVFLEEKETGAVYLDLSNVSTNTLTTRYRSLCQACADFGIDLVSDKLKITPVAHYTIGGIKADLEAKTTVSNLWAVGEVANTRFHGRDRLASNSLLECIVSAFNAAKSIQSSSEVIDFQYEDKDQYAAEGDFYAPPKLSIEKDIKYLQEKMWEYASFDRDKSRLESFIKDLEIKNSEISGNNSLSDANYNQLRNMYSLSLKIIDMMLNSEG